MAASPEGSAGPHGLRLGTSCPRRGREAREPGPAQGQACGHGHVCACVCLHVCDVHVPVITRAHVLSQDCIAGVEHDGFSLL